MLDAAERAAAAVALKVAAEAEANAAAREALEAVKRGEPLEMVKIAPGSYRMGCASGRHCDDDETPVHRVHIERSFAMSKHEVTFVQWAPAFWAAAAEATVRAMRDGAAAIDR